MADKLFPQNHFYWNCMVKQFTRVKLPAFSSVVMLVTLALTLHVGKFKRIWLMREWFKTEFLIWRSQLVDDVYFHCDIISHQYHNGVQKRSTMNFWTLMGLFSLYCVKIFFLRSILLLLLLFDLFYIYIMIDVQKPFRRAKTLCM